MPTAPSFNAAFYSVAATVIPVLFLAIAVQGDTYKKLLRSRSITVRRILGWPVIVVGVTGKGTTLGILYSQSVTTFDGIFILVGTIYLTVIVAAGPLGAFFRATQSPDPSPQEDPA